MTMKTIDAMRLIYPYRGNGVVIACQQNRIPWSEMSDQRELDVDFGGCMGKGSSLGLGIALARPDVRVIVFDGDGSLLMNLGSLVTIANMAPRNLYHFIMQNGVYAGTGGQPIPAQGIVSFAGMARAAGYRVACEFHDLEDFANHVEQLFSQPGPVLVTLHVEPEIENRPIPLRPRGRGIPASLAALKHALAR